MDKPVLVIMAAGMGSRYGGLKQIDPIDKQGHKIIDFSIYDAIRAGFGKVIFVIKREMEEEFRSCIGDVVKEHIEVAYAYQEMGNVPEGCVIPIGREKPWGTAHAVLSAKGLVNGPFAVINADDYYGEEAFRVLYDYLAEAADDEKYRYCMVGYELGKTLTEFGSVSRGVCDIDGEHFLTDIVERTAIERRGEGAVYTEDGVNYKNISTDRIVSMNMWGFTRSMMDELETEFARFFREQLSENPLKAECYLPFVVDELLKQQKATVKVLTSSDRWFGITYKEDKPFVVEAIADLKKEGLYPEKLWEE